MIDVALFYQEIRAETLQHLHLFLHCSRSFALQAEEIAVAQFCDIKKHSGYAM